MGREAENVNTFYEKIVVIIQSDTSCLKTSVTKIITNYISNNGIQKQLTAERSVFQAPYGQGSST